MWSAKYATQQKWYSKQVSRPLYCINSSILEPMEPLLGDDNWELRQCCCFHASNSWELGDMSLKFTGIERPFRIRIEKKNVEYIKYFQNLVAWKKWQKTCLIAYIHVKTQKVCLWSKYVAIDCVVTWKWWLSTILVAVTVSPWAATEQPDLWLCLLVHWSAGHSKPRWLPLSRLLPTS